MRLLPGVFAGRNIQQPVFQKFGKVTPSVRHHMNMYFMGSLADLIDNPVRRNLNFPIRKNVYSLKFRRNSLRK